MHTSWPSDWPPATALQESTPQCPLHAFSLMLKLQVWQGIRLGLSEHAWCQSLPSTCMNLARTAALGTQDHASGHGKLQAICPNSANKTPDHQIHLLLYTLQLTVAQREHLLMMRPHVVR